MILGLDAGSVSVKGAIVDGDGTIIKTWYLRHRGNPYRAAAEVVRTALQETGRLDFIAFTGSSGKVIAASLGLTHINEIVAQVVATRRLFPGVRTIIEMGGEDSKLILLDTSGIRDFSMNSVCAAGTGSFLDQQAERLRLSIEEFGTLALSSRTPPRVAGRCSVFAKSDMIHLQQIATPLEDIVAGLCFAVARNFKGSIVKGRDIAPPVSFQGGVAANPGMRRAFAEVLEIEHLVIPEHFACMGAIGAALKSLEDKTLSPLDIAAFQRGFKQTESSSSPHPPLMPVNTNFLSHHHLGNAEVCRPSSGVDGTIPAYMGIDIGSISTNLAVIDSEGRLLAKRYLMTAGRPIEAVLRGLREIEGEIGEMVAVRGVGTTGSGRYMIADFVGADIVKNEITAQATAATFIDPRVDTIFEIGGQDSKYISLRGGVIVDFEMNKACAAGTGSFLEEQAEKLNIPIKEEFARAAFSSQRPCRLGERCTVFMENSLMANLKKGVAINDLLSGLAYSIVENYINRVVSGKRIGENIFFQGGVAFNKSVVAAFEKFLDTKITVPPHHDVTGAIGMALIARDHADRNRTATSTFKGFGIHQKTYETSSFECRGCPNVCEINRVKIEGEEDLLFYGGRCEKYDIRRKKEQTVPDLFAYREEILWKEHLRRQAEFRSQESGAGSQKSEAEAGSQEDKTKTERLAAAGRRPAKIGIPYIFLLHDYLPFWTTFFWELGFEVVVSPKTNRQIVNLGVETVQSESCFPVKVAHGHIRHLLQSEVDMIFLPSFIRVSSPGMSFSGSPCPYTQSIPYMAAAAFGTDRFIKPVIDMSQGEGPVVREMFMALKPKRVKRRDIKNAYRAAQASQDECERLKKEKGAEVLESLHSTAVVIVGRGYNSFDRGANLQIPQKLATLDMLSIPMDFLPLDAVDISGRWENMYWRNGTRILQAARIIKSHPHLFPIFIGNFSCGPDSFILKYFTEELGSKPFLHIEIDEHSADAGAITRCEAYLDSIRNFRPGQEAVSPVPAVKRVSIASLRKRKIYIPKMSDHAYALSAAFTSMGIEAAVMPPTDETAIKLGRKHVSGKECYPCAVTTGDMLKQIAATGFDPDRSAFFMPSGTGPCRFGQYHVFQRLILDRCGYPDVKIYSPVQSTQFYHDLGIAGRDFATTSWKGIIAIELLTKMLHETRPYERDEGESCAVYHHYLHRIENTLKRGGNGSLEQVLKDMHDDFRRVARDPEPKPLVGIVGEIFVRSNAFSNESIVKKVEQLGGEAWLAPVEEWIYYVNTMALRKALRKKEGSAIIELFLKSFFQKRIEHRYAKHFDGYLKTLREPKTRDILRKAAPYIHDSFEGEAVLSIGKTIDLIERGASGIINVMPFGCMPGTVVSALLQTISRKYHVPCISIGYDGTESTTTYLQLEAFMEQAKSRHTQSLLNSRQSEDRPSDRRGTYLKGG